MWNPFKKFQAWRQARKETTYQDNPNEDALSAHDAKMVAAMQGQSPFTNEQAPVVEADQNPTSEFKIDLDQLETNQSANTSATQMENYQSSTYESYQVGEAQPVVIDVDGTNEVDNDLETNYDDFVEQIKSAISTEGSANDEIATNDVQLSTDDELADDVIEFVLDQEVQVNPVDAEISANPDEVDKNLASDFEPVATQVQVVAQEEVKPVAKATSSAKTKKPAGTKASASKKAPVKKPSTSSAKKSNSTTKKASAKKPATKKTPVKKA